MASNSRGLVALPLLSCLGGIAYVGYNTEVVVAEMCKKGSKWIKKGGFRPSKGHLHQDNHRRGNCLKIYLYDNQIVGRGLKVPRGLE